MSVGLGTAVGYLKLDVSGFASGVDSAISDMNHLDGKVKTASQGLQTIGSAISKTGAALTAGLTAPVVGFGAASVKAGMEFDTSISQVSAVAKATGEDLELIRDRAIEMGEKTRYSAKEVSDAMYYMGLAGWDAQQIYEGIPGVLALGAASGEDLARVSDIVTDSLTAFGKSAEDTTEFVNVLAEASRSSNTTVDMLGESFKYVGPVAGAFGYSIQDVATALGIFANNGVKGSQAGTGLRQALNALINPSEKAAAEMERYGVSLFNSDGSTKSLMQVMEELRGTFGGLAVDIHNADGEVMTGEEIMEKYGHSLPSSEMEKLTAVTKIFGVRALPGMLSVINASDESFYGLAEAINGAQDAYDGLGTAFGMQETMLDNLQGDWYLFTSALGTTKILISDMAKGALRDLVQSLTNLVNKFNEMDPAQREQVVKWALIAASIGPVLVAFGKAITGIVNLVKTFNTLKSAFTVVSTSIKNVGEAFTLAKAGFTGFASQTSALGTALAGITGPMIAMAAAIAAVVGILVAAFVNLWKNNEEFRNKIIEIWNGIKAKFEEAGQRIVEIFNELGFNFEDFSQLMSAAIEALKMLWNGFCEILAPIFTAAFAIIGDVIGGIVDLFVGIIEIIVGIVKGFKDGDWSMLWKGIGDIVVGAINMVVGILDHLAEAIWNIVQTIANWFGADWNMTWDEAKQAVADWFNSIVQWIAELAVKIVDFFSNIWQVIQNVCNFIVELIPYVWDVISGAIEKAMDVIETVIQSVWNNIKIFLSTLMEYLRNMFDTVWNAIKTIITTVTNAIYKVIDTIWNNIKTFLNTVMNVIRNTMDTIWNAIKNIITTVTNAIYDVINRVWNTIKTFLTTIVNNIKQTISDVFNAIKTIITDVTNAIYTTLTNVWNNIKTTITNVVNNIKTIIVDTFNNIKKSVSDTISSLYNTVSDIFGKIKTAITDAINKAKENAISAVKGLYDDITGIFNKIGSTFSDIGKNIIQGIINGINSMTKKLKESVKGVFDGLVDNIKNILGIKSPSRVMRDKVGIWLPPGIAIGFAEAMPTAIEDMEKSLNEGINSIEANDINAGGISIEAQIDDFADAYRQVFEGLVIWFETMEERMAIAIEGLVDYFEYLMYVRQILDNDNDFKTFVLGENDDNKPKKPTDVDTPNTPISGGGDTFNFYSPTPINEVQAARMLRNTKRDMAEGF